MSRLNNDEFGNFEICFIQNPLNTGHQKLFKAQRKSYRFAFNRFKSEGLLTKLS